jgi:hypothetical protein
VLFVSENRSNAHRENPYSRNPVNPVSHATYLLQKIYPHLDFTSEEILTQIDQFVLVTTYISRQLKTDIKKYYHYWIFKLFQESCDAIGLTRRQEVTNYDNAVKYAGDNIKACFILQHVITKIKDAFTSYLANRVVFIHFIMEDRKMSIIECPSSERSKSNFPVRLIRSVIGDIQENFTTIYGKVLGPGCKWEQKHFKANRRKTFTIPKPPIYVQPNFSASPMFEHLHPLNQHQNLNNISANNNQITNDEINLLTHYRDRYSRYRKQTINSHQITSCLCTRI